jgi:hypothetical protein
MPLYDQVTDTIERPDADKAPVFEVDFKKMAHHVPILPPPQPPME